MNTCIIVPGTLNQLSCAQRAGVVDGLDKSFGSLRTCSMLTAVRCPFRCAQELLRPMQRCARIGRSGTKVHALQAMSSACRRNSAQTHKKQRDYCFAAGLEAATSAGDDEASNRTSLNSSRATQSRMQQQTTKTSYSLWEGPVRVATQDLRVCCASCIACGCHHALQSCSCTTRSLFSRTQRAYSRSLVCTLAPLFPSSSPCVLVPRAGVVPTTRVAVGAIVLRLALPAHTRCAVEPTATGGAVCTVELASRG